MEYHFSIRDQHGTKRTVVIWARSPDDALVECIRIYRPLVIYGNPW